MSPGGDDGGRAALARFLSALFDGRPLEPVPGELLARHRLAPLAYRRGLAAHRADYITSTIRAEQQRAIATEAVAALAVAGIPVALLKGISYAGWLYADPGERPMTDVDLLVPLADHARAVELLGRLDYRHVGPGSQRHPTHHAMTLKRPHASVDLHRSPAQIGRIRIDFDGLWQRTSEAPWVPGARRLDLIDETLCHFANLARHDLIAPMISYVDAGYLLRALGPTPHRALMARAEQWRFARVLGACVELVNHVLCCRKARPRWWLPSKDELLDARQPARPVQLGRKLLLVEGPSELVHFLGGIAGGLLEQRRRT